MLSKKQISHNLLVPMQYAKTITQNTEETINHIITSKFVGKVYRGYYVISHKLMGHGFIVPSLVKNYSGTIAVLIEFDTLIIPKYIILFKCKYTGFDDLVLEGDSVNEKVYNFEYINPKYPMLTPNVIKMFISKLDSEGKDIDMLDKLEKDSLIDLYVKDVNELGGIICCYCNVFRDYVGTYFKILQTDYPEKPYIKEKLSMSSVYVFRDGIVSPVKKMLDIINSDVIDFLENTQLFEYLDQLYECGY